MHFRYLVEAMEKCYLQRFINSDKLDQYSKETTPINQILGGYLRSTVRCLACHHLSTTYQHFQVTINTHVKELDKLVQYFFTLLLKTFLTFRFNIFRETNLIYFCQFCFFSFIHY